MQGKVEICGVNTSRLPVLKNEEAQALLERAKAGDKAAREELISGNLRLVLSVIQKFSGRGENVDDLFQVGCIGLIKAIDNFDVSQNVRFSTYGVPMIAGETGREPTTEEIASALGIRREEVVFSLDAISDPVSLFEPVYSDAGESVCVMDQIRDDRDTDESWLERLALSDAISALGEREKRILALRYYDGKTQMEVADEIHISQAQVSRLEKNAIAQIKKNIFAQ